MERIKIAFILPYFGKFDKLFPLWLESCRYNTDIDWLIFTDDKTVCNFPPNVKVTYMSFSDIKRRIQQIYNFPIALNTPYRLCNFKPAYGEIFKDYLFGYDAWGFCDNDMLYGDLRTMIPNNISSKYKIGEFGHLSFVNNTEECCQAYRYAGAFKIAFETEQPLFFDEGCFVKILRKLGYKEYKLKIADFIPRIKQHIVLNEEDCKWKNKAHCFVWDKGKLWRYFADKKGNISKEEYAYIHFLKRPMEVVGNIDLQKPLIIIPNKIFNMPIENITPNFLLEVSKPGIFWAYWQNSFKPRNIIERLKNRLYQNKKNRILIARMEKIIEHNVESAE